VIDLLVPPRARPTSRSPARQWGADLLMGARLAASGGRDGLTRTAMTAIGVGLGVAMLLLAAAVPGAWASRDARLDARQPLSTAEAAGPGTELVADALTTYREVPVRGELVQPEGPGAPLPPGLTRLPATGEAYVSPALRELLASDDGVLLRPRVPYKIVGTIGAAGLSGPAELSYYAGNDHLATLTGNHVTSYGLTSPGEPLDPVLTLFVVVIFVVLLLPIGVFVASAVRFGGDQRDRRLAALRLVGADSAMARRIAAGEALAAALLGLLAGGAFFLLGRRIAQLMTLQDISVYASDIHPGWALVALVALLVPVLAVVVTLLALRGTMIEPLGVVRRGRPVRGRLWWRLLPPVAGLWLLYPLFGRFTVRGPSPAGPYKIAAGVVLLLVGVAVLLPWVVEATVAKLGRGPVAWQLAMRRLQASAASPGRVANGIAVAVAGAIALQMLFLGLEPVYSQSTGVDLTRATMLVATNSSQVAPARRGLAAIPGVTGIVALRETQATADHDETETPVLVADCADLRQLADLPTCDDGDAFLTGASTDTGQPLNSASVPEPGTWLVFNESGHNWQVPAATRRLPSARDGSGAAFTGLLVTPAAIADALSATSSTSIYLYASPKAVEQVRNAVAVIDPTIAVLQLSETDVTSRFADVRRGLFIGAVVTLLLIGLSLLVGVLEQLRDRRRLLAVLAAVGTRRGTLGWSVLWQTAVPVTLGLLLAVPAGIGLGGVLLAMVDEPLHLDWPAITGMAAAAAMVVLLVTAASLPVLWRVMRADGLRTE
jgi:hypothetical protein